MNPNSGIMKQHKGEMEAINMPPVSLHLLIHDLNAQ